MHTVQTIKYLITSLVSRV